MAMTRSAPSPAGTRSVLEIVDSFGNDDLARVFVARLPDGALIEFVESVQPPVPREQKWVLIVSTLKGCPIGCPICDAGGRYAGRLTAEEILAQIDHLVEQRYPDRGVAIPKLKIQFARMGDPALNPNVLEVLRRLPARYPLAGLMPSISTVAPRGCARFFEELLALKRRLYPGGRFQMQFSVHASDESIRRRMVPVRTWTLREMADYGDRFWSPGDRKVTLNFAPARDGALDASVIRAIFDPGRFLIKLTPINPTTAATRAGLVGLIDPAQPAECERVAAAFRNAGFETLISIGDLRENEIGSNCGMYVSRVE
jgi:23S rRNA (adenine2503-C2)-methyltransferase